MKSALLLVALAALSGVVFAQDDGMPFGPVGDAEIDRSVKGIRNVYGMRRKSF